MASFYRATVEGFLSQTNEQILARLATGYANRGYTSQYSDQTLTWERDLVALRAVLEGCVAASPCARSWGLLLEFSIPRKERRIDIVLLVRDAIVFLEAKTGEAGLLARRQTEEYALLLHYFHKGSSGHRIVPVVVSPEAMQTDFTQLNQQSFFPQLPQFWITPVVEVTWFNLAAVLFEVERAAAGQMSVDGWDASPYFPVPTIIDAALALRTGLSIREIAHSEASEHEIEEVCVTLPQEFDATADYLIRCGAVLLEEPGGQAMEDQLSLSSTPV